MGAARFTYNQALGAVKSGSMSLSLNALRDRFVTTKPRQRTVPADETDQQKIKRLARESRRENADWSVGELVEKKPWLLQTPKGIRYNALRSLMKAYKSNRAKQQIAKERGDKAKKFTLKFKRRTDPGSWTIELDKQDIRSSDVVPRPNTRRKNDDRNVTKGVSYARRNWTKGPVPRRRCTSRRPFPIMICCSTR